MAGRRARRQAFVRAQDRLQVQSEAAPQALPHRPEPKFHGENARPRPTASACRLRQDGGSGRAAYPVTVRSRSYFRQTPIRCAVRAASLRRQRGDAAAPARVPPREDSMANKMLIDATHPEETRVVVLRGNRVEEFDFESAHRRQLRGNIYLAKVTRVEPSLQAAFVDYGGNRHGFLAFSEIHPDYYQIPVADRQALIAQEERDQRAADAEADNRAGRRGRHRHRGAGRHRDRDVMRSEPLPSGEVAQEGAD